MKRSRQTFLSTDSTFPSSETGEMGEAGKETIADFANRVLFGSTLEEKLRRPSLLSLTSSPSGLDKGILHADLVPGRPEGLTFARSGAKRPNMPSRPDLVDEKSRGVLLHFFANHELLAAELMALALLKFPDAPEEFRKGLIQTLKEEQYHTKWYVRRMAECGVEFGEYPLNRFFWDAVSSMESPLDYVSRLSLTFEQANLDYALHYSGLLEEAGDSKSSAILKQIYQDEISHVGYGLTWFRNWKNKQTDDWAALKSQLHFPLSPSRAKGNKTPFNREGRIAAGFDESYVDQLEIFDRSNGRTPNVFYFNPDAENQIGALPSPYHPNVKIRSVIEDLEILSAFTARRDDVLLMRRPPSAPHRRKLLQAGFILPEIEAIEGDCLGPSNLILNRKLHAFRPWSLAPNLPKQFNRLELSDSVTLWKPEYAPLFSKAEQAKHLAKWMGPSFVCESDDKLPAILSEIRAQGWNKAVLKKPFSTAGNGMQFINLDRMESCPSRAENMVVEPFHDRVFDFSVQFDVGKERIRKLGIVHQLVQDSGAYRGSRCFIKTCEGLSPELSRFLMEHALPQYESDSPFITAVFDWLRSVGYRGPMGIDAYVFREPSGNLGLRPACEINPRYTMGRVALELRKQIASGYGLEFRILRASDPEANSDAAIIDSKGKMSGGSLILNDLHSDSRFAAKIKVAKKAADL
ncbi:MAG: hypothetical protein CMO55_00620 [Verrucomicrobiales bacterium]|nr:hypothetical protein [Verrucomicrobiales bacterium]